MFVFLDDCWCESYAPGIQPEPVPGQHNSVWCKDPSIEYFGPCGSGCLYAQNPDRYWESPDNVCQRLSLQTRAAVSQISSCPE